MVLDYREGNFMIRTTVYLPDDLHNALKHLAVEKRRSMADLLRIAAEQVYEDDFADLRAAQKAWRAHRRNPGKAVSARKYFAKRM